MPAPPGDPGKVALNFPDTISPEAVAAFAYQAGFRGVTLQTAVAVSFAENGSHDLHATHVNNDGSVDTGLWQINSVHGIDEGTLKTADGNASAAYRISSAGRDWTPWTTYKDRAYLAQVPAARNAIATMNRKGGAAKVVAGALEHAPIDIPTPADVARGATGALTGWVKDIANYFAKYLKRGLQILGGLILMILGVFLIAKDLGMSMPSMPMPIPE